MDNKNAIMQTFYNFSHIKTKVNVHSQILHN